MLVEKVDLEDWRQRQGLTYRQLAEMIGGGCTISMARKYALGMHKLVDGHLDRVIEMTKGEVGAYEVHRRRMAWLQKVGHPKVQDIRKGVDAA